MPVVGQTPGIFVKAGAAGFVFSPACVVALAKLGMAPGDFGTYSEVRAQQEAAREKCRQYDEKIPGPNGERPAKPTDRERFIGGCQAGHLTQNATQQRKRGDACSNATPGYSDDGAPCGPHYGNANTPGTEHYLVTRREQNKPQSTAAKIGDDADKQSYPPDQRAADDAKRGQEVQAAIANNNKKYPKQLKPAKKDPDQKEAAKNFRAMQKAREKAAAEVMKDPAYKKARAAADPAALKAVDKDKEGKLAAECIEAFRKAGMRQMKKNAAKPAAIRDAEKKAAEGAQPSKEDPKKTNQEIVDDKLAAARAREAKAKTNAAGIPRKDKSNPANKELAAARQDRAAAEKDANQYKDAQCRADQGKLLNPKTGTRRDGSDPRTSDGLTGGFGSRPAAGTASDDSGSKGSSKVSK